jgi:hypothetical protein
MEAADAGDLGPAANGEVQGVGAEAATGVPEPQRKGVGQAMLAAQPQVTVEGAGGLRAERHQSSLAALPDVHGPAAQVQILDLEGDRLAGTQTRLGAALHQPDDGDQRHRSSEGDFGPLARPVHSR